MEYENPLDHAIHRFQHRWETDRQFRAAMSGALGLLLIVVLCSGVGVLDLAATRVLAAVGINAAAPGGPPVNTTTGSAANGNDPLYTPTVATWAVPVIPQASPIASSGTPAPSPTPVPTPTDVATTPPCTSNCGGGPIAGNLTATPSPSPWTSNQQNAAYIVHATDGNGNPEAGVGIGIIFHWATGTFLDENGARTDGSGNYTSHPVVGTCPSNHSMGVTVFGQFPGGTKTFGFSIPCN